MMTLLSSIRPSWVSLRTMLPRESAVRHVGQAGSQEGRLLILACQ